MLQHQGQKHQAFLKKVFWITKGNAFYFLETLCMFCKWNKIVSMENISKKSLLKKFNFKKKCPDKQQGVFKNTLRTTKSTRKTLICLASSTYY